MIQPMQRIQSFLQGSSPVRWLFNGDSITHGVFHTHGSRDYTQLFCEHLRSDMGRTNDLVINSACSGDTTVQLLETFEPRVSSVKPHVVFYMIGMNDAHHPWRAMAIEEFRDNLNLLVHKTKELGALTILQTCNNIWGDPQTEQKNEHLDRFMAVVREVAAQNDCPLVDHHAFWSASGDACGQWLNDPIHPNAFGHRVFFRQLIDRLNAKANRVTPQEQFEIPGYPQ
jgi:lysophospholipase L1-like esterase